MKPSLKIVATNEFKNKLHPTTGTLKKTFYRLLKKIYS